MAGISSDHDYLKRLFLIVFFQKKKNRSYQGKTQERSSRLHNKKPYLTFNVLIRPLFCPQDSKEAVAIQVLKDQPHLFLQQTSTLDYIIILSGELYLTLEEEETILKAGVIVLQCRTYVAWSNLSDKPTIQLAILLVADYE